MGLYAFRIYDIAWSKSEVRDVERLETLGRPFASRRLDDLTSSQFGSSTFDCTQCEPDYLPVRAPHSWGFQDTQRYHGEGGYAGACIRKSGLCTPDRKRASSLVVMGCSFFQSSPGTAYSPDEKKLFSLHFLNPFVCLDLSSSATSPRQRHSRPTDILWCLSKHLESFITSKQRSKNNIPSQGIVRRN